MTARKEAKLRADIIEVLKARCIYETTDDLLIDELLYQYVLIDAAKKAIKKHGIMINVSLIGERLFQINQAISIYNQASKTHKSRVDKDGNLREEN
jgi:hypothetical protein